MAGFEGNPGISRLGGILSQRMKQENAAPLIMDFGEIQGDYSLVTNTFPVSIPKGDYSICRHVRGLSISIGGGEHFGHEGQTGMYQTGSHEHTVELPSINPGERVLVAWVQSEAVVVDVIGRS